MPPALTRREATEERRARIVECAIDLFLRQGYVETTIDQIAEVADVGRRTVVRHFGTKSAILLDHVIVRREVATRLLRDRPPGEAPFVSLHRALRDLSAQGFDRQRAAKVRKIVTTNRLFESREISASPRDLQASLVAALKDRTDGAMSVLEIEALTSMVLSWFEAAARMYFKEGKATLVEYYDQVVALCLAAGAGGLAEP